MSYTELAWILYIIGEADKIEDTYYLFCITFIIYQL